MQVSANRYSSLDSGVPKEWLHIITGQELMSRRAAAQTNYLRALQELDTIVSHLPGDRPSPRGVIPKRDRARIDKAVKQQRIAFDKYMDTVRQLAKFCGHIAP